MSVGDVDLADKKLPEENNLADASSGHRDPRESEAPPSARSGGPRAAGPHYQAPVSPWARFARVPPLAMLAACAALAHTVVFRLLLPLLASKGLSLPALLHLAGPYSLNLAACAGLVALTTATFDMALARELTYLGRRLIIAMLAGVLLLMLALSTFLPPAHVQREVVLLGAAALHTFVVQVAITTFRAQRSLAGRTTVALVGVASLFPLATLIVRHAEPFSQWSSAAENVASLHALGELAYLFAPIAAAFVVLPWGDDRSARSARRAGAIAVCFLAILFGAAARLPNALYGHVMYSALRLEWALERASLGYAVPISLAVGAATAACFSRDSRHRQGGAGIWLWLAGGYNPLTPGRLFMTALAAMLICRAILSVRTDDVGAAPSKKAA
jgi:hypothetical protein